MVGPNNTLYSKGGMELHMSHTEGDTTTDYNLFEVARDAAVCI